MVGKIAYKKRNHLFAMDSLPQIRFLCNYQERIPNKQGYFCSLENYCIFSSRVFSEYQMIGGGLGLGIVITERGGTTNMGELNIHSYSLI